jgi:KDO2-lipid IV(A) lauroyltransferase
LYYALKALFWGLGKLPFGALYALSDGLCFIVYRLVGYRKAVVFDNLRQAFPEKGEAEIRGVARAFYRNLCDQIVETVKLASADYATIRRRFDADWSKIPQPNCLLVMGHQFNWEWGNWVAAREIPLTLVGVYAKIKASAFEKLMWEWRSKGGEVIVPGKSLLHELSFRPSCFTVLIADQNPGNFSKAHWTPFFGRPVPFNSGPERLARSTGHPVVFLELVKTGRGRYTVIYRTAFEQPKSTRPGEITEAFARFMESAVRRQPENWMWSHKRWKHTHKFPANVRKD